MSRWLAAFRGEADPAISARPKSEKGDKGENALSRQGTGEFPPFSTFSDFGCQENAPSPTPAPEPSDPIPLVYEIDPAPLADAAGHFPSLDGYKLAALRRPPSLSMNAPPGAGCFCACCAGQRWWCEREAPSGWRCATCYAPDHLPANAVRELRTCAPGSDLK